MDWFYVILNKDIYKKFNSKIPLVKRRLLIGQGFRSNTAKKLFKRSHHIQIQLSFLELLKLIKVTFQLCMINGKHRLTVLKSRKKKKNMKISKFNSNMDWFKIVKKINDEGLYKFKEFIIKLNSLSHSNRLSYLKI